MLGVVLLAGLTWNWYVEDQTGLPTPDADREIIRDIVAQYAMSIAPYSVQTAQEYGNHVTGELLQGSNPGSNGPAWSSPYTPLGDNQNPHSYIGPQGDGSALSLGVGGTHKHWIENSQYPDQWKIMRNNSPLVRIKRTSSARVLEDEKRLWTGQEDPGGDS
jgi:hypothetical protein